MAINICLIFAIPKDKNNFLCAYNDKIALLQRTKQPRVIIIGGSSVAFGTDSKKIGDSLHCHVVNFGLHGGIGIRYPMEDALQYLKRGDVVVLQIEYANFFSGGCGEKETIPKLMIATNWRNANRLDASQWLTVLSGMPQIAVGNVLRLLKYPLRLSFDSQSSPRKFEYLRSGFNEYGDEVSHFNYPNIAVGKPKAPVSLKVNNEFVSWLKNEIALYEKAGVKIIMLPPVIMRSFFRETYNRDIEKELIKIRHPYIVTPQMMMLDDSCSFNGGYHVNKDGVDVNSRKIIQIMSQYKTNIDLCNNNFLLNQ